MTLYIDMLFKNGLTGSDITKADITRISAELKRGVTDPNTLQKKNDWAKILWPSR